MDIYGINNISNNELNYNYDKHYKQVALKLKQAKTEEERKIIRSTEQKNLSTSNSIKINIEELKENFIELILDKNSSKYLWILYSKYKDEENYIDKISPILKKENSIIRGGTNTYKMNGWMAHTLYVYQIVNYNIANNKEILNFNGNEENKKQVEELNKLYNELNEESKFILKIFALIHDIGVIEDITHHPELGSKYVEQVLKEIDITSQKLEKNNIKIKLEDLIQTLKVIVKYHILITGLSTEASDKYVELAYRNLISNLPDIKNIKSDIPKILFIFAYGDIIAVDESLMNIEKYNRVKDGFDFFEAVTQNKIPARDKEKVAIERICDIAGKITYDELKSSLDNILKEYKIDKSIFIQDMYNIKNMRFASPLMKTLNNLKLTIKIYYDIFELIGEIENKEALKDYTIVFVPDKHENDFVKQFENGNFFKCIKAMKMSKENSQIYGNIEINRSMDSEGKNIYIRVV
ncbi:MAG: hypothetical protein J6A89_05835 [Clostridia bacterium]|nr:hypothetical protein [Clostridia bacterium]